MILLCTIVKPLIVVNYFRLEVRQISEGIHHVPGMVEAPVDNMSEVWEVLQTGSNARAVGSTNCNEHSSRSHWFVYLFHICFLMEKDVIMLY